MKKSLCAALILSMTLALAGCAGGQADTTTETETTENTAAPEESTEAKTGAVMFAVRAGVPVVPVYIPRKKHWFRFTRITVGEAYYPDVPARRSTPEDYQRAADELMRRIYALGETA